MRSRLQLQLTAALVCRRSEPGVRSRSIQVDHHGVPKLNLVVPVIGIFELVTTVQIVNHDKVLKDCSVCHND